MILQWRVVRIVIFIGFRRLVLSEGGSRALCSLMFACAVARVEVSLALPRSDEHPFILRFATEAECGQTMHTRTSGNTGKSFARGQHCRALARNLFSAGTFLEAPLPTSLKARDDRTGRDRKGFSEYPRCQLSAAAQDLCKQALAKEAARRQKRTEQLCLHPSTPPGP